MARRRWKRALVALAIGLPIAVVVVLALSVLLLPVIVTDDRVKREAVSALTEALGTPVEIDRVSYHPLSGIELFGIVIGPPKGFERDVARIDRVALLYDLSGIAGRSVTVREIAVENPRVTIEAIKTPEGAVRTNLDAISEHLAKNSPPADPPAEPATPLEGPLSPVDVVLEKLALTSLSVEKVGEGPHFSISGLSLTGDAKIDRETLHAALAFAIAPPSDAAAGKNASFEDPAKSLSASLQVALTATTTVDAGASDGLELGALLFGLKGAIGGEVVLQGNALPPLDVGMTAGMSLIPETDRLSFAPLRLYFSKSRVVDLSARVDGLVAAAAELLGPIAAKNLADQLGLQKKRLDDVATLSVSSLALPLDLLTPYASVFVPGLVAKGTVALAPLEVTGTLLEVLRGAPRDLRMRLAFDEVAVDYPAAGVTLGSLAGELQLARAEDGAYYGLEGSLAMENVAQLQNRADRATFSTRAKVERLTYPLPGATELELSLSAEGIRAPPATVNKASIDFALKGTDVLHLDRAELPPVETAISVKADRVHAVTGTATHDLQGLAIEVRALADRLLLPAKQPITSTVSLSLRSASLAGGIEAREMKIELDLAVSDPRTGAPIDADAKIVFAGQGASTPQAVLEDFQIELAVIADDVTPRRIPNLPAPTWAPASTDVQLAMSLPNMVVHDKNLGDIPTTVALKTNFSADLIQGSVTLRALAIDVWDVLKVRSSGRFGRLFTPERTLDARFDIQPIDLAQLIQRVPRSFLEQAAPGLTASGKLGLSARAKGVLPEVLGTLDLGAPPIEAHVLLTSEDVSLSLPSRKTALDGFSGRTAIDVGRGKSELTTDLTLKKLGFAGNDGKEQWLDDLTLRTRAGLRGDVWELSTDLDARGEDRVSFDIDLTYAKRGEMQLRRFDVRLPGTGLELDVAGRLVRREFGVLRPELAMKAKIDFDRLRNVYPGAGTMTGVVGINVDVSAPSDTRAMVSGVLELAGFGYAKDKLLVQGATGRIPIEQRLALPAPIMREQIAGSEGVLGDDLERRIQELQDDFLRAKLIVDSDDILLEAPRAADYQPLRPYYAEKGAHLSIDRVKSGPDTLRNVVLDGLYKSGVLRADRFAAQVWEGDILGDLAVQVTSDLNVRIRQRGTITKLNLDIPYSQAKGIPPVSDPQKKEAYEVAGTIDLRFLLHERSVTMKLDLTKLRKPTLERLLGYLDPKGTNPGIDRARFALSVSETVGLKPVAGQFVIAQNLVSMNVDWNRVWWPEWLGDWTSVFTTLRVATIPLIGSLIVGNVNGALGDKTSIGPFIVPAIAGLGLEDQLQKYLGGRVIAEAPTDPTPARRTEARTSSP